MTRIIKILAKGSDKVKEGPKASTKEVCGCGPEDLAAVVEEYMNAMNKHAGGVANYRASEGKTVAVPFRGNVKNTITDILGGIRSTCTYVGARRLKELTKRTTFIRVAEQENKLYD